MRVVIHRNKQASYRSIDNAINSYSHSEWGEELAEPNVRKLREQLLSARAVISIHLETLV